MSTALLERPAVAPEPVAVTVEIDHRYCCDPDLSLCGLDISMEQECPTVCLKHPACEACEELNPLPCGPACPWMAGAQ